ncbi:MAG: hypothetical protein J0H50_11765 [Xanthomonadales bacterium]|nr:hypothetical protein [Xanthomonadales bacterium]
MKLLHAVIRFCATGTATGRGGVAVPQDFRVTVPAPLSLVHGAETGVPTERSARVVHTASQDMDPATILASPH